MDFKAEGEAIYMIGEVEGQLGQSLYLREIESLKGDHAGKPPVVHLENEKQNGTFIRDANAKKLLTACHDISEGGLLCAIAEMAMTSNIGCKFDQDATIGFWFGEDQAR